jgi:hypothetical protein
MPKKQALPLPPRPQQPPIWWKPERPVIPSPLPPIRPPRPAPPVWKPTPIPIPSRPTPPVWRPKPVSVTPPRITLPVWSPKPIPIPRPKPIPPVWRPRPVPMMPPRPGLPVLRPGPVPVSPRPIPPVLRPKYPTFNQPQINMKSWDSIQKSIKVKNDLKDLFKAEFGVFDSTASRAAQTIYVYRRTIATAADGTGKTGVSKEFIAAILAFELLNRGGFLDRILDSLSISKTKGVGQINPSTLAMALGMIPWREYNIANLSGDLRSNEINRVRQAVKQNYEALPESSRDRINNIIENPVTNIQAVGKILNALKNRKNRYASRPFSQLSSWEKGIIATEYNMGPSNTLANKAQPSDYGKTVARLSISPRLKEIFNF